MTTRTRKQARHLELTPEERRENIRRRAASMRNVDYWNAHVCEIYAACPEDHWLVVVYDDDQIRYFDDLLVRNAFLDSLDPFQRYCAMTHSTLDSRVSYVPTPFFYVRPK